MSERPFRFIQCPYCKQKFGIQQDQAVVFCFFCGGRLDLQPKIRKPSVLALWLGTMFHKLKANLQERRNQAESIRTEEVNLPEITPPFVDESPVFEMDDFHFDPVEQIWMAPAELEEPIFVDDELEVFDPVDFLRNDVPQVEERVVEVKTEPLDPIERLRHVVADTPVIVESEKEPEPFFSGRTRLIVLGAAAVVVVFLLFLLLARALMG